MTSFVDGSGLQIGPSASVSGNVNGPVILAPTTTARAQLLFHRSGNIGCQTRPSAGVKVIAPGQSVRALLSFVDDICIGSATDQAEVTSFE